MSPEGKKSVLQRTEEASSSFPPTRPTDRVRCAWLKRSPPRGLWTGSELVLRRAESGVPPCVEARLTV